LFAFNINSSGCCCDTRKAVFVVNIISICFSVIGIIMLSLVISGAVNPVYEDDEVQAAMDEIESAPLGFGLAVAITGMICHIIAIYGAAKYSKIATIVGGMWYVISTVISLIYLQIGDAVMGALFAYPHFVFWYEMRNGVMTPETYPNEKVCCECCGCC
jgi:uncharacterized membrane protein